MELRLPIETERLVLRELHTKDVNDMYRLDTSEEVHKYLGEGWMNESIEDAKNAVDSIIEQYKVRGIGRWAAVEKSSGQFIGWSGLKLNTETEMNGYRDFYDIGYRLLPEFWGKGYATESSVAALKYGFNVLNLDTIFGITHFQNEASHRVLLKIGLEFIDYFYHPDEPFKLRWYEMTKADFEKKHNSND